MIAAAFSLLGFFTFFPCGEFLSWPKKIIVILSLSLIGFPFGFVGFDSGAFIEFITWENGLHLMISFGLGAVLAFPFLMALQVLESAVESLEIIRGVNLSSVLSPLTQQNEMPLVMLATIFTVGFVFIDSELFRTTILFLIKVSSLEAIPDLPAFTDIIEKIAKTFLLYPMFFVFVAITMLTSDLILQSVQKVFPLLPLQDLGFFLRALNAMVLVIHILPNLPSVLLSISKQL